MPTQRIVTRSAECDDPQRSARCADRDDVAVAQRRLGDPAPSTRCRWWSRGRGDDPRASCRCACRRGNSACAGRTPGSSIRMSTSAPRPRRWPAGERVRVRRLDGRRGRRRSGGGERRARHAAPAPRCGSGTSPWSGRRPVEARATAREGVALLLRELTHLVRQLVGEGRSTRRDGRGRTPSSTGKTLGTTADHG